MMKYFRKKAKNNRRGPSERRPDAGSLQKQDVGQCDQQDEAKSRTESHLQNDNSTQHQGQNRPSYDMCDQDETKDQSQSQKDDHARKRAGGGPQNQINEVQSHRAEQMETHTNDQIQAERDAEMRCQTGDKTQNEVAGNVYNLTQKEKGVEILRKTDSQLICQQRSWDHQAETKKCLSGEEHELPKSESSLVGGMNNGDLEPLRYSQAETKKSSLGGEREPPRDKSSSVEVEVAEERDLKLPSPKCDRTEIKNNLPDEKHELPKDKSVVVGTEAIQGDSKLDTQSPKGDKTGTKDSPPDKEHELPKDKSSVVGVEAAQEGDSKLVTGSMHFGRIKNMLFGIIRNIGGRSSYPQLETERDKDGKENDIIIAVMGPTGSGKSKLVYSASGCESEGVGSGLKSFTSDVRAVRFREQESGRFVVLVDTPGFDDTFKSDFDILNMISDWLNSSYKKGKLLSGILYLHRITDNRVAGTSLKNLRVFRQLCGDDALEKVYLTTTMWDEVTTEVGERRLEELKSEYWKKMINHGAHIFSCGKDGSPNDLVRRIIEDEGTRKVLLQEEMVELQKEIKETKAGQELYSHLEVIVQKRTEVIGRLNEAKVGARDPRLVSELQEQLEDLRKQMDEMLLDMERLKLPLMQRFFSGLRDPPKLLRSLFEPFRP